MLSNVPHSFTTNGRIDETNSRICPEGSLQITTERHHARWHPSHESAVAHQSTNLLTDLMLVVAFEVAIVALVKREQNRHDFTQVQGTLTVASFQAVAQ